MEIEEGQEEAHVGSIGVSASVMPELEAYMILLVLMIEADKSQFAEVCMILLSFMPLPAISIWSCHFVQAEMRLKPI